jgi:hypothetical protein
VGLGGEKAVAGGATDDRDAVRAVIGGHEVELWVGVEVGGGDALRVGVYREFERGGELRER